MAEAAAGIALIATGILFLVLRDGGSKDSSEAAPETISATVFELAVWDSVEYVWETDDVVVGRPLEEGGMAIPFLLRLENTSPSRFYRIELTYGCGPNEVSGLEFLTDFDRSAGSLPALTIPGPGREVPDAAAVIGDDPSIPADEARGDRRFRLWGATFAGPLEGPTPPTPCDGEKTIAVSVRAQGKTVQMLWGAQLDSAAALGDSAGPGVFWMKVAVQGIAETAQIDVAVPH